MNIRAFTAITVGVAGVALAAENVMLAPSRPTAAGLPWFVRVESLDFKAILPAPPPADSLAAQADLETVRQVEAARSSEDVAWAKLVEKDSVFNHASVLGAWFTPENLPRTAEFFQKLGDDLRALDGAAKQPFLRPRPTALDPGLRPCVALPASTSYPSGSAMQAWVWAELLGEMLPAKREALRARSRRAGWGRVIGGVHFPSDVVAGQWLGRAVLAEGRKNPAFQAALALVRGEIIAAARTP